MMRFVYAVVACVALAGAAHAADFAAPLMEIDGKTPLRINEKIATLGDVAQTALLSSFQDEVNLPGEEKMHRYAIARKIEDQRKDPALSPEDIALIKKLVAKAYNPLVTGDAWHLLDPASAPR